MDLESLYPNVLPSVRGCPHITALDAIQAAALEFCRRTLIWRKTLPAVSSVLAPLTFTAPLVAATSGMLTSAFTGPTRTDYVLTFSDGTLQIVTLNNGSTSVTWQTPITATASATYSQVIYTIPATAGANVCKLLKFTVDGTKRSVLTPDMGEDITIARDHPDGAWTVDRANFQVTPAPRMAGTQYGLTVALEPADGSTTLPDEIGTTYAEVIAHGAIYRLERMNGWPWSNEKDAAINQAIFNDRIHKLALQAQKGFGRGRTRVKGHFF